MNVFGVSYVYNVHTHMCIYEEVSDCVHLTVEINLLAKPVMIEAYTYVH